MQIQQAVFGSKLGGHALLSSSDESLKSTFRAAAWATDLPSTIPTGVTWEPYLRTVCIDNYFVLISTRPDEAASRAGMVISRAAFFPIDKLHKVSDLRPLARTLSEPVSSEGLQPLLVDEALPDTELSEPNEISNAIASAIVNAGQLPIVHVGQKGFDEAMLRLWACAPVELRKQLLFGLSFGPDDTVDRNLVAVCTPNELKSRWAGFKFVDTADVRPLSIGAAALLDVGPGRNLREFAEKMAMGLRALQDISVLQRAYELWTGANTTAEIITFIRLLAARVDSVETARQLKAEAVNRLTADGINWSTSDVLSMRNLNLAAFSTAETVWRQLSSWSAQMEAHAGGSRFDVSRLLADAVRGNAVPDWSAAVIAGARRAFMADQLAPKLRTALWSSILQSPGHTKQLLGLAASTKSFKLLWDHFPHEIEAQTGDTVAGIAAENGWWEIAGVALAASHSPIVAARKILALGPTSKHRALIAALSTASPSEVVEVALQLDGKDVIKVAGEKCAEHPALLGRFDWQSPVWWDILVVALNRNSASLNHVPSLVGCISRIISEDELPHASRIWSAITSTELGDISSVPNRPMAWGKIPDGPKVSILALTAQGWLNRFEAGNELAGVPEPVLLTAVQTRATPTFLLEVANRSPGVFVRYLREIFQGSDYEVKTFIREIGTKLPKNHFDSSAAIELGNLIRQRAWPETASVVAHFVSTRRDFVPIVQECQSLLNIFERMGLALALGFQMNLTGEEAWEALETEALGLYPSGPSHEELWSRSGGRNSELPNEATGRAKWHRCLKEVRAGRRPSARHLVQTMLGDYPHNKTLLHLRTHEF